MERLTKKGKRTSYRPDYPYFTTTDCIRKLGKLEDIEQELGIDLITLFKALKQGIYTKGGFYGFCYLDNEPEFVEGCKLEIGISYYNQFDKDNYEYKNPIKDECLCIYSHDYEEIVYCTRLCDYGKTWVLTKEELSHS